jgi:hypothetical protein
LKAEIFRTTRQIIRWGGIIIVTYLITDMFKFLSENNAVKFDVVINTLLNLSASIYVSYGITISAILYGVREKILRRKTIKEMGERIVSLEKRLWGGRTSSNINKDGTTPKEDL